MGGESAIKESMNVEHKLMRCENGAHRANYS